MTQPEYVTSDALCPYCGANSWTDCRHFLGWTNNGKTYYGKTVDTGEVLPGDQAITTRVVARVYREQP